MVNCAGPTLINDPFSHVGILFSELDNLMWLCSWLRLLNPAAKLYNGLGSSQIPLVSFHDFSTSIDWR